MSWKLLLVDPHPMLRKGVRHELARFANVSHIEEASTGAHALKLAADFQPDLVLMEVRLADHTGLEIIRQLIATLPRTKVAVFSSDPDRSVVDEALQAGASGYILKTSEPETIFEALLLIMAGKLYVSPEITAGILEDYRKTLVGKTEPTKAFLSDRELHLLRLVAAGKRNKEIAAELALSIKSVEAYRSRLMKKLSCPSSAEMVRYAVRNGIAPA